MNKKAVIVGCDGQDGRLLFDLLGGKGYEVAGISRGGGRGAAPAGRVDALNAGDVERLLRVWKPDEVYYLAAYHHSSQDAQPGPVELFARSSEVHVAGLLNFLEAARASSPATRLFYAASSHIFGAPAAPVQDEATPLAPKDVYGITKACGLMACRLYREEHKVFASVGILYNHESIHRGEQFVSRKIVRGALAVHAGRQKELVVGDLSAGADWGYAPDFVEAMRLILVHSTADDFVVATGEKHSVADFAAAAFSALGLDWKRFVREDPSLVTRRKKPLVGDAGKLRRAMGWAPTVDFNGMVRRLLEEEKVLV